MHDFSYYKVVHNSRCDIFLSVNPKEYILAGERDFTDDITNIRITHYECIKDGKIILSSDEAFQAESIEEFKANAKRLIQCDTVNVEFEKIGE